MISASQALSRATSRLAASSHLAPTASRDAERLLLHAISISRATLLAHPERLLSPEESSRFDALLTRRFTHEPMQYILGEQEFFGLPFRVTPAVLIPRPETELLVEAALARLPCHTPLRIADVGTGSGAIAIAIAANLPQTLIVALDLSPEALAIARENAARHSLDDRIQFLHSDLLAAVADQPGAFDAILSNPPYVATADRDTLHPQVRDHEPPLALFAGASGLDIYRRLLPQALSALRPGGLLALEFGHGQQQEIAKILENWASAEFLNDLQGIPRIGLARRP